MTTKPPGLDDPKRARTQGAIAANMRRQETRSAAKLAERGWGVVTIYQDASPEEAEVVAAQIARAIELLRKRGYKITKG